MYIQFPKGRCNEIATYDVMMDKSKYSYEFVKFGVGNVINAFFIVLYYFQYPEAISNQHLNRQTDMLNLDIWPVS